MRRRLLLVLSLGLLGGLAWGGVARSVPRPPCTAPAIWIGKHQARLEQSKRPLYYAAMARAQQGKKELAELMAAWEAKAESQG